MNPFGVSPLGVNRHGLVVARLVVVRLVVVLAGLGLSACDVPPQTGQAQADAETRAACRNRAEQAYDQQHRAEIYSPPPPINTPYSANYGAGLPDRGLSDLYAHDRMVSDCIRNTGTGSDRPESAPRQR